jgi:hypothetical protein
VTGLASDKPFDSETTWASWNCPGNFLKSKCERGKAGSVADVEDDDAH